MSALIDPPEGHLHGFPKPAPVDARRGPFMSRLPEWLVENGYPQELITLYDAPRFTRVIGRFMDDRPD